MATKDTILRATKAETKAESTTKIAKGIIDAEVAARQEKTDRLRAARRERDATAEPPAAAAAPKRKTAPRKRPAAKAGPAKT